MAMSKKEQQEFLARWGNECLICGATVPDEERVIEASIQKLEVHPPHAEPFYTHYYVSCKKCREEGELI